MPSLFSGYEYDIFISYRQKDNRGERWVSGFVQALRTEIEGTFKEDISIYFDENPQDGLLETHHVNKSLDRKLKCLIFIPIISQTYCDPKSFAWQEEFCVFNRQANEDAFGRDITLANGNVASRILPIKIHEIDKSDQTLIENETGGALRAIEFIYKEPGVHRPLTSTDNPDRNQNKTLYRNQLNKVANAIKEIVEALKNVGSASNPPTTPIQRESGVKNRLVSRKGILAALAAISIATIAYYFYQRPAAIKNVPSVAVLAFADLSPGKDQEWFSDGLTEEILNSLTKLGSIKVTARTSSFYFKGREASVPEIAEQLGVEHVVEGSVRTLNKQMRITAQLIRASDGFHVWSETYERTTDDLFAVQADIAEKVARALQQQLSREDRKYIDSERPANPRAYSYFLKGSFFHDQLRNSTDSADFRKAEDNFLEAIRLDAQYGAAYGELANLYDTYRFADLISYTKRRDSLARIAYRLSPNSITVLRVMTYCFTNLETPIFDSAFHYLRKAYAASPQDPWVNKTVSDFYLSVGLPDLALDYALVALERDPLSPTHPLVVANCLNSVGDFQKAEIYARKAIELNPNNIQARFVLLSTSYMKGDTTEMISRIREIQTAPLPPALAEQTKVPLNAMMLTVRGEYDRALKLLDIPGFRMAVYYFKKDEDNFMAALQELVQANSAISYPDLQNGHDFRFVQHRDDFRKILEAKRKVYELNKKKYGSLD